MSKKKLDKYHYHEAMDRTVMITNIIESELLKHPVIKKHKCLKKKVKKSVALLLDVYMSDVFI